MAWDRCASRRLYLAVLTAATCAAPAASRAEPARPSPAMAAATAFVAAWNKGDADAAAALLADDVTYYDAAVGQPVKGRAAVRDHAVVRFRAAAPDARWTMNADADPVVTDEAVVFQWTLAGRNTGRWANGTPATGRPFTFGGATILKVHDGKITYVGHFYDSHGFFKQLGLAQ